MLNFSKVNKVTVTRGEGPCDGFLCSGTTATFTSLADANKFLRAICATIDSDQMGSDKVDFTLEIDGQDDVYSGTALAKFDNMTTISIEGHINATYSRAVKKLSKMEASESPFYKYPKEYVDFVEKFFA